MPASLWWLCLGAFAIGTEGFMIAGLLPTLAAELGVSVPAAVLARMRAASAGEAAGREGIAIARDVALGVKALAAGVHVAAPGGRVEHAMAVLDGLS